ncbi:hypothetical protein L1049_023968 [Liquidambar formosana]|uniref:Reticulon-like protein n=1 Tax=Liquidambar formosana TaxID=63359 RepID=A0AAP0RZK4_LIQFO
MALEAIGGAVLGTLFSKLIGVAVYATKMASDFDPSLENLKSTLSSVIPKVSEIELDNYDELIQLLEEGTTLVDKCSKVDRWKFHKKLQYRNKLRQMDASICKSIDLNLRVEQLKEKKGKAPLKEKLKRIGVDERIEREDFGPESEVFRWRGKLKVRFIATAAWVAVELYQVKFVTLASWVAMSIVTSLFIWGKILRLLNEEPPSLSGLEITEKSAMEMANSFREWIGGGMRWLFRVSAERDWFVFAGVVAGLWLLSLAGSFFGFFTCLYIGIMVGLHENTEQLVVEMANLFREWIGGGVRWMFLVGAETKLFAFVGALAGLWLIFLGGTSSGFFTGLSIGIMVNMIAAQPKYFEQQGADEYLQLLMNMGFEKHSAKRALAKRKEQIIEEVIEYMVEGKPKKAQNKLVQVEVENEKMVG